MAQFVAFDPNVEVSGASILSVVAALGEDIRDLLAAYGITELTPNSWYPQQMWLDAFREIAEGDLDNMFDLVNVGIQTPQNAFWPQDIQSVEEALQSLNEAYHMNHRGGEIGYYEAIPLEDGGIKVICENPYPCDFDYGLIYGVVRMYAPEDAQIVVEHDPEGPCRKHGEDVCVYYVYVE